MAGGGRCHWDGLHCEVTMYATDTGAALAWRSGTGSTNAAGVSSVRSGATEAPQQQSLEHEAALPIVTAPGVGRLRWQQECFCPLRQQAMPDGPSEKARWAAIAAGSSNAQINSKASQRWAKRAKLHGAGWDGRGKILLTASHKLQPVVRRGQK
jgi:hypothetical protein